ncbi:hypothetical protein C7377_1326 [Balneicella halophila]|uniref:Uncharacterized protein n=1 Tax=Balneicella halophila TaxID=1537566 RepID=A0A7L4UQA7_BALHA|nr:hypothetical protein C7377_1326 [Balneicella halophila]
MTKLGYLLQKHLEIEEYAIVLSENKIVPL